MAGAFPGAGSPPGDSPRYRFPRSTRLRRGGDIQKVRARGKRRRTECLDVFFAPSPASHSRVGIIVPRHRHTAVERNRVKRRLRELSRVEVLPRLEAGGRHIDLLLRARQEAYGASFAQLKDELVRMVESEWRANS